jgi:hypothetical protein
MPPLSRGRFTAASVAAFASMAATRRPTARGLLEATSGKLG